MPFVAPPTYYIHSHCIWYCETVLCLSLQSVPGEKQKVTTLKGSDKILPSLVGVVTIFLVCQVSEAFPVNYSMKPVTPLVGKQLWF